MVRKKASTDSDIIALVGDSQQLQVIDQEDGWVKVAVDNDVVGYVSSDYVDCETKFVEAESIETSTAREEAVQSALDRADQMKEAAINAMNNADANEAAYAAQQQAQASQQQNQNWSGDQTQQETQAPSTTTDTTTTPDYTTGDTTGSTTTDSSAPSGSDYTGDVPQSNASSSDSLRQSVVNYALQFVGNPYVYGGTSLTNGTDCSGFTQSVLANFGISISRTAASQSGGGTAVDMSNLQPGDLLFYDNGSGIGHVSMYIGNGQVVHASNEQTGIIVSSVDTEPLVQQEVTFKNKIN